MKLPLKKQADTLMALLLLATISVFVQAVL